MAAAALVTAMGCGGGDTSQPPKTAADSAKQAVGGLVGGLMKMAQKQDSLDAANPYAELNDPCTLVSRAEAEKYLGPLAGDPYRSTSGGQPEPSGGTCTYRGANGQSFSLDPNGFKDGQMAMRMIASMGGLVNTALVTESGSADTLDGDWDDVRWSFGAINALKGDVLINIDVSGSSAGVVGAADLANIAIHRLDHPLAYDGAKAAGHAPGPLVTPRDPCSLVTAEEAAAILGPLAGSPTSTKEACTYPVASGSGTRPVTLEVVWSGGFKALNNAKATTKMVNSSFTEPIVQGANAEQTEREMAKDSDAQKFMKQVSGVMRAMGGPVTEAGTMRLKTDTTGLKGPWDQAAILNGFSFSAEKKDVLISVSLQYLDQDKASALLTKAMGKI